MRASTLLRLSGLVLILPIPLWVVGQIIHPRTSELADVLGSNQSLSHAILAVAWMLVLLGLSGLYSAHAARSGVLGLVGFVLMVLFAAYHVYMLLYEAGPVAAMANEPEADRLFAAGGVVQQGTLRNWFGPVVIGAMPIYGVALLRSGVFSRWAGWLVIAFVPAFFAFNVLLNGVVPAATRETLLDLGFANIGLGVSYLLGLCGLAIAGYQLWATERSVAPTQPGH